MLTSLLAFAGAVAVLAIVPGPSTAIILRRSVVAGRRSGLATVIGDDVGVLVWGVAAAFGLSALLVASQLAYDAIRVGGAVILVVMGVRALWAARRAQAVPEPPADDAQPVWRSFRLGLVTNLANPKAGVFAISFLPQFVPHGAPALPVMLALSLLWALIDASWSLVLVWLAGRARRTLRRPAVRRWLERVSGVVLVGLGVRLALES